MRTDWVRALLLMALWQSAQAAAPILYSNPAYRAL